MTTGLHPRPVHDDRRTRGPVRVGSIPQGHVYVRHLADPDPHEAATPRVVRLDDPDPGDPDRPAGATWWPPAMLDTDWLRRHRDELDVVHLNFGFDAVSPDALRHWVACLRELDLPLVQTVHDLRNPHHASRGVHDDQLDVLVPAADALVTLTPGAADEVERRWGRRPVVLPHPHVVPLDRMAAPRRESGVIGVHAKSLRACMDPLAVLDTIVDTAAVLPGASVRVDVHRDVVDPSSPRHDAALVAALRRDDVDVHVHDFFTDEELWDYLAGLSVSVLPYRFGTHSGWLEACLDLGTAVVAPTCGFYAQQGPVSSFAMDEHHVDTVSLADAVTRAWTTRPAPRWTPAQRREQRRELASAHAAIYERLLVG